MKVLIVNTSERTGGAAVAAHRLMEALNRHGVKTKMLVRDKESDSLTVVDVRGKWRQQWNFLWERLVVFCHCHFSRKHLFEIDIANVGTDITTLPEFREADIIHLHWINQGMLSLKDIRKILDSGKAVVWTMHDIWPATAICHLTLGCNRFREGCHHCKYLPGGGSRHDLSARVWRRKQQLLMGRKITFVACSRWLAGEARESALLRNQTVTAIPNPINVELYKPGDKTVARRRLGLPVAGKIVLFVSQRVTNRNKGMDYLIAACHRLAQQDETMRNRVRIAVLGGHAEDVAGRLPFEVCPLGYVNDEHRIVEVYRAADVFVLPSLSENLPNTIMEAMACGVPCIGFNVGGIPEEIDHGQNGYVAAYRDADDLAKGIRWVLEEADCESLGREAVSKVMRCYSGQSVASKYMEVYDKAKAREKRVE